MKSEEAMRNLTCDDLQIMLVVILKLVTEYCVHVSAGLASGGGGDHKLHIPFGRLLLGGSNTEKWGDHQKKKFFIGNSVEALI